jgi:ATP-binding cassette, subfamily C (CFTR/MRP), member 2
MRTYITSISILNRGSYTNILTPTLKVMREGRVVQSGKYDELLKAGLDFGALLEAHESSMKMAETSDKTSNDSAQSQKLARIPSKEKESGGEKQSSSEDQSKSEKTAAKLIEDEERETGQLTMYVQHTPICAQWLLPFTLGFMI